METNSNRELVISIVGNVWEDLRANNSQIWQLIAVTTLALTFTFDKLEASRISGFLVSLFLFVIQATVGVIAHNVKYRRDLLVESENEYSGRGDNSAVVMGNKKAELGGKVNQLGIIQNLPWFPAFYFWIFSIAIWLVSAGFWAVMAWHSLSLTLSWEWSETVVQVLGIIYILLDCRSYGSIEVTLE